MLLQQQFLVSCSCAATDTGSLRDSLIVQSSRVRQLLRSSSGNLKLRVSGKTRNFFKRCMRKAIPNILTCLNMLSGCVAVVFVAAGEVLTGCCLVFLAAFFAFSDGFAGFG